MRTSTITLALYVLGVAQAGAVEGSMTCQVMSNSITFLKEGRPEFFSGFEEQFGTGNALKLTYSSHLQSNVYIELKDEVRDLIIINGHYSDISSSSTERISLAFGSSTAILSEDLIKLDSFGELILKRYYKSDWHGYYIRRVPIDLLVHVATLDCRTETDSIREVIRQAGGN